MRIEYDENGTPVGQSFGKAEWHKQAEADGILSDLKKKQVEESDYNSDRYRRNIEMKAEQAMRKEASDKGFQGMLYEGIDYALMDPRTAEEFKKRAKVSTKAALEFAGNVLADKSTENAGTDFGNRMAELSGTMLNFADAIHSQTQDKFVGTNLRYGLPIGTGPDKGRTGSEFTTRTGNRFVRPELEGVSLDSAWKIPDTTSYGIKPLGDRVRNMQDYAGSNSFVDYAAKNASLIGVPVATQYHNMRSEGLNPGELSNEGYLRMGGQLAGNAAQLALSTNPWTAVFVAPAIGALGTELASNSRPKRYEGDELQQAAERVAAEYAFGAAGGALGIAVPKMLTASGKKVAGVIKGKHNSGTIPTEASEARIETLQRRADRAKSVYDNYKSKVEEGNRILSGDDAAMRNAFIREARMDPTSENVETAWQYAPGYFTDRTTGIRTREAPWIAYASDQQKAMDNVTERAAKLKASRQGLVNEKKAEADLAKKPSRELLDHTEADARKAINAEKERLMMASSDDMNKKFANAKALGEDVELAKAQMQAAEKGVLDGPTKKAIDNLDELVKAQEEVLAKTNKETKSYATENLKLSKMKASKDKAIANYVQQKQNVLNVAETKLAKAKAELETAVQKMDEMNRGVFSSKTLKAQEQRLGKAKSDYDAAMKEYNRKIDAFKVAERRAGLHSGQIDNIVSNAETKFAQNISPERQAEYRANAEELLKNRTRAAQDKNIEMENDWSRKWDEALSALNEYRSRFESPKRGLVPKATGFARQNPFIPAAIGQAGTTSAFESQTASHDDIYGKRDLNYGTPWYNTAAKTLQNLWGNSRDDVNLYRGFRK